MDDIWQLCNGSSHIKPLHAQPVRIVESQEQVATNMLVDSADEQLILEQLLEASKPPLPENTGNYHYLITTPFRYPPLKYGSRFGSRNLGGIFYASSRIHTALAECAYYRFLFWYGMAEPPPKRRLDTAHSSFVVQIKTAHGIHLEQPPFDQFRDRLSHPADYRATQQLGEKMRNSGIEAFSYPSARDPRTGINIAVLQLTAITSRKPLRKEQWLCTTRDEKVSFVKMHCRNEGYSFSVDQFYHHQQLPQPACR